MRFISQVDSLAFYLLIFSLPFGKSIFVPILFVWLCVVFFSYFINRDYSFRWVRGLLSLSVVFYLLQLVGLATSNNLGGGLFDMQLKLSLLLLPILYPHWRESYRQSKQKFLIFFASGCAAATILYLGYAIFRSCNLVNGSWIWQSHIPATGGNFFLNAEFSYLIHPSYLALYILVAILIIGFELRRWRSIRPAVKFALIFDTLLLLASIVLLQSRAGIFGFGLLSFVWILYLVFAKRRYILGVGVFFVLMGLTILVFTKFNRLSNTAKSLENTIDFGFNNQSKEDATATRIWIWKSAFSIIKEHPVWGVGTGDVRDELQKQYEIRGMTTSAQLRHNAHNQYLETWLGTGIFGLLALLAMLFVPLWVGVKKGDWLVVGFLSLCSVSFMFESMLNTIAGVGFFAIFYTILVSRLTDSQKQSVLSSQRG